MLEARKSKNELAKNVLSVALGDIQVQEGRAAQKGEVTDGQAEKIIQKLIKSNQETMDAWNSRKGQVVTIGGYVELGSDGARYAALKLENEILTKLLPKTCTKEEIKDFLVNVGTFWPVRFIDKLKEAKSNGQATGLAMKELASLEGSKDGKVVAEIVKELRS